MSTVTVINLLSNEEYTYIDLLPVEALISAAIWQARETTNITNPITRQRYAKKLIVGKYSMSIDNVAIKL